MEAPRWRLNSAHYLKVPELPDGTRIEHEHKETSRESGRTIRRLFAVPMLLDPRDPADHNYPGEIIVANEVEGAHIPHADYIFIGSPTPEMEPLNDAARAITDSLRERWDNPIESLPANGGMNPAESVFMQKMMETFARIAPPAETTAVSTEQFDELKAHIARLEAIIAGKSTDAPTAPARRV